MIWICIIVALLSTSGLIYSIVDTDGDAFCDNEQDTKDISKDCGWIEVRGKHYCEECHHYGDNDELILGDGTVITVDEEDWQ